MSVGNRHDAEDLTTQTFLKMLEAIGKFRFQAAPFSAWLFRIAHNLAMDTSARRGGGNGGGGSRAARLGADVRRGGGAPFDRRKSMLELIDACRTSSSRC